MKPGDGLLLIALLVWLSVRVGPWWLGVVLFVAAWVVNLGTTYWCHRTARRAHP